MTVIRALIDSFWWYYRKDVNGVEYLFPGLSQAHLFDTAELAEPERLRLIQDNTLKTRGLELHTFTPRKQ